MAGQVLLGQLKISQLLPLYLQVLICQVLFTYQSANLSSTAALSIDKKSRYSWTSGAWPMDNN